MYNLQANSNSWACSLCTLQNESHHIICSVCESRRFSSAEFEQLKSVVWRHMLSTCGESTQLTLWARCHNCNKWLTMGVPASSILSWKVPSDFVCSNGQCHTPHVVPTIDTHSITQMTSLRIQRVLAQIRAEPSNTQRIHDLQKTICMLSSNNNQASNNNPSLAGIQSTPQSDCSEECSAGALSDVKAKAVTGKDLQIQKMKARLQHMTESLSKSTQRIQELTDKNGETETDSEPMDCLDQCCVLISKQHQLIENTYIGDEKKDEILVLKGKVTLLRKLHADVAKFDALYDLFRKRLVQVHDKLKSSLDALLDENLYKEWSTTQIGMWIETLENGRYKEYVPVLLKGFSDDGVRAIDLPDLDGGELKAFGIKSFADRKELRSHLARLRTRPHLHSDGHIECCTEGR